MEEAAALPSFVVRAAKSAMVMMLLFAYRYLSCCVCFVVGSTYIQAAVPC